MSGEDVKADAEVAKGSGAAPDAKPAMTVSGRGRAVVRPAGKAGRPPGITDIIDAEPLRRTIREMRRDRVRITQGTVSARSGLSVGAIRGYLEATVQTWAEFLASF